MLKLTFDGTKFRDDQGMEVVNPEEIMEGLAIIKTDGKIDWPYGYEIDDHCSEGDKCTGNDNTCEGHPVYQIKLIHPSERANDRHEKSKQLFKEFLNSEEAKEIIGTMKDEKLTPEQGSELVEIYKKAGWHEEEANKTDMKYQAMYHGEWKDLTENAYNQAINNNHHGRILDSEGKIISTTMKDFKKFTTLEETPTTATNSTEAKPERGEITPIEVLAEYFHINVEAIQKDLNAKMTLSEVIELIEHLSLTKVEAKPEPTKEQPVNNIRRDLYNFFQTLIARNYNNIGKWNNQVQQYNFELIQEVEKILIDNPSQPSPSEELTEDRVYEATPQKGVPGHCYAAQVFKNGIAFLTIDPTPDEMEATRSANHVANCLNRIEGKRLLTRISKLEKQLAASESRVRELEERIEALLDNHGLTHAKIKQIAAEDELAASEALVKELYQTLKDTETTLDAFLPEAWATIQAVKIALKKAKNHLNPER